MSLNSKPPALYLQIESVVSAGDISDESIRQINVEIQDLPHIEVSTERARRHLERLLKERRVLAHAAFLLQLTSEAYAYHFFDDGQLFIEASSRLLGNVSGEPDESSKYPIEINLTCTFGAIGGTSKHGPNHLPMRINKPCLLGCGGNDKTFLFTLAKLIQPRFQPNFEMLKQRADKFQLQRLGPPRHHPINWSENW
jgi:hypothetical protein